MSTCTTLVIVPMGDWAKYAGDPEYRTASDPEYAEALETMSKKFPEDYRKAGSVWTYSDGTVLMVFAKEEAN